MLNGCIPWPHMSNTTPEVKGVIFDSGKPVSGIKVRLVAREEGSDECEGRKLEVISDSNGFVDESQIRHFNPVLMMMAHSFFEWSICAEIDENWVLLHSGKDYSLVDTGPISNISFKCDDIFTDPVCSIKESYDYGY